MPEFLRPWLLALARRKGAQGGELLFGGDARGRPHQRGWPLYWARKICDAAGVPVVSAHSMRGLHSTLAIQAGATSHLVAGALGHGSDSITKASYMAPGTADAAERKAGLRVLDGGKTRRGNVA